MRPSTARREGVFENPTVVWMVGDLTMLSAHIQLILIYVDTTLKFSTNKHRALVSCKS